ncbi:MAG: RNA-binding S4 domain-containing protein [Rhodobacteraceae bacterium]|nr:RNA-binding S4 domain-containing protein [Paracoccaceae bacterium]
MSDSQRIDKWLWHARFFKTRTLAAKVVSAGHVRINSARVKKPATLVRPGDGLSFMQGRELRIVRISALGQRRGPASEAAMLYHDLTPVPDIPAVAAGRVGIRPTKKDRRAIDFIRHTSS